MTYEELASNIAKSRLMGNNFNRAVRMHAYNDMLRQHQFCDELRGLKQRYKAKGIIHDFYYIWLGQGKSAKHVIFTIYTKIPKYRTYKQQYVITAKRLEKQYRYNLWLKDLNRRFNG